MLTDITRNVIQMKNGQTRDQREETLPFTPILRISTESHPMQQESDRPYGEWRSGPVKALASGVCLDIWVVVRSTVGLLFGRKRSRSLLINELGVTMERGFCTAMRCRVIG